MGFRAPHLSLLVLAAITFTLRAGEKLPAPTGPVTVQPKAVELKHPRQPQSLQILAASADGYTLDLRPQAKVTVADPKVAAVDENGWIRPVANGQTQVTITVAGQTLTVPVKVQL